jgi:hypothetical protein
MAKLRKCHELRDRGGPALPRPAAPHFLDGRGHINDPARSRRQRLPSIVALSPSPAVKRRMDRGRNKPTSSRIHMPIPSSRLLMGKEPLRNYQIQIIFRSGHRHIEKPSLLVDLFRCPSRHIGRNAAVNNIQDPNSFPFLPLR